MKVLVIGNGGREDAICKKISESNKCTELFCSKGNAGTLRYAENVELNSNEEIFRFSNDNNIYTSCPKIVIFKLVFESYLPQYILLSSIILSTIFKYLCFSFSSINPEHLF